MRVTELDLSPAALACLRAAGITRVDQFTERTCGELVHHPNIKATDLYETICQLNQRGYSLPQSTWKPRLPDDRAREMLRLRIIDGLSLAEIGRQNSVSPERVRQILKFHFRLTGKPPAAKKGRLNSRSNVGSSDG